MTNVIEKGIKMMAMRMTPLPLDTQRENFRKLEKGIKNVGKTILCDSKRNSANQMGAVFATVATRAALNYMNVPKPVQEKMIPVAAQMGRMGATKAYCVARQHYTTSTSFQGMRQAVSKGKYVAAQFQKGSAQVDRLLKPAEPYIMNILHLQRFNS